jgi:hypothetical protein
MDPCISRYLSGLARLDASPGSGATCQLLQPPRSHLTLYHVGPVGQNPPHPL